VSVDSVLHGGRGRGGGVHTVVVHTPVVHAPVVKPAQTAAHSLSYVAPLTHTGSHTSGHIHGVVVEVATPAGGVVVVVTGCVDAVVHSSMRWPDGSYHSA
jgi:hypothetical protein